MIKIIKDKKEWDALIETTESSDFYHSYDYHQIAKNDEDLPILIHYEMDGQIIALPLLIRPIDNTEYYDATSVYGYPGPVARNLSTNFDNSDFGRQLHKSFLDNNIVSAFSRLNPFIPDQEKCLSGIGEIKGHGIVVNIDLTLDLDIQRQKYQKRLKSYVNKAHKECDVFLAQTEQEILQFTEIYYENMIRVNAHQNYFFKKKYFFDLLESTNFQTDILLVKKREGNEIIGGAMFIKKNKIVQYHLSGAKEKYLHLNPIKLLIDKMRINATEEGYTFFNLGGGVGSNEDSLFRFKSNFSKDFWPFKLWKWIVNEDVYEEFVRKKQSKECLAIYKKCPDYFPCYRCNINNQLSQPNTNES